MASKATEPILRQYKTPINKILQESSTTTNKLSTSHYIPKEEPEFSELRIYDFIIDLYYSNSAIVKLFRQRYFSYYLLCQQ